MKNPEDDVAFADGHCFMVEDAPYKAHLKAAKEFKEVSLRPKYIVRNADW